MAFAQGCRSATDGERKQHRVLSGSGAEIASFATKARQQHPQRPVQRNRRSQIDPRMSPGNFMTHRLHGRPASPPACSLMTGAPPASRPMRPGSEHRTDGGQCERVAPCRTPVRAQQDQLAVINVGPLGPLVTKPISLIADGVQACLHRRPRRRHCHQCTGVGSSPRAPSTFRAPRASRLSPGGLHVHNTFIRRSTNGILFAPAAERANSVHGYGDLGYHGGGHRGSRQRAPASWSRRRIRAKTARSWPVIRRRPDAADQGDGESGTLPAMAVTAFAPWRPAQV